MTIMEKATVALTNAVGGETTSVSDYGVYRAIIKPSTVKPKIKRMHQQEIIPCCLGLLKVKILPVAFSSILDMKGR